MTSRDHPDNTHKPIVCLGLFYSAFSTSGLSTAPISHKSKFALEDSCQIMLLTNNIRKVYESTHLQCPLNIKTNLVEHV